MQEAKKLKGFRDVMPQESTLRDSFVQRIREVATLSGFVSIDTPSLEYEEILLGQGGDETDKQVYRFEDHGGRKVALRFDLTVPFARFVAENQNDLVFPFRRFQVGHVWRGENPQKGRYREFMQCDLDIIGSDSESADAEVLLCMGRMLQSVSIGEFAIGIGSRPVLSKLIEHVLGKVANETAILIALDKLDKIGKDKVVEILEKNAQIQKKDSENLLAILLAKDKEESDANAYSFMHDTPEWKRYQKTIELLKTSGPHFKSNLAIARGLGYYTGIVFETHLKGREEFGSIASGGRYNDLVSRFSKRAFPGIGGSIGIDRLVAAISENAAKPLENKSILIAVADPAAQLYAFSIAESLRQAQLPSMVALENKLGDQMRGADRRGIAWVITVGSDEMNKKTYNLKDMQKGQEEKALAFSQLVATVSKKIGKG